MFPVITEIPIGNGIPIYSYGVMLGTSMIVAWYFIMWLGEREGFSRDDLANTFIVTAVSAIVGSRLLYIATNPDEFTVLVDWFNIRQGGLVAYGGFLGGAIAAGLWLRRTGKGFLRFADVVAPVLATGLALTRIGCYLYGCDYGARLEADAPSWLRDLGTFPHWADDAGSPAWSHHVSSYGLDFEAAHSFPVHPTQLYESLVGFCLCGITLLVWKRRRFHGEVLLILAMLYGIWRFFIEFVRDDPERGEYFGFSTSQLISLAIVPVAAFAYQQLSKKQKAAPVPVWRLGEPVLEGPVAEASAKARAAKRPQKADPDSGESSLDEETTGESDPTEDASPPSRRGVKPKKKKKKR